MNKDLIIRVANEVKSARKYRKLTQKELAERMGTSQTAIARVENAKVLPTTSFLNRMAKALEAKLVIDMPDLRLSKEKEDEVS